VLELPLTVKLPDIVVVAKYEFPLTDRTVVEALPKMVKPETFRVPVVERFSSPKLMLPVSELIWENLTMPVEEAVAKFILPVVMRFSSPKEIRPVWSVMEPSERMRPFVPPM
jgi:hypothetical protein